MKIRLNKSSVKAVLCALTTLQKVSFAVLFSSATYVVLAYGSVVGDEQAGSMRIVAVFFLMFQLQMILSLGALLYRRSLKTTFCDFFEVAERAGREVAFMSALSPVIGEMLYEQTLPRVGFLGLMQAREQAVDVAV